MEKRIKISTKNNEKLELFLLTLKEVAKDMHIKVEALRITKYG